MLGPLTLKIPVSEILLMLCHNCLKFVAFHLKEILCKEIKNIINIRNSGILAIFSGSSQHFDG